MRPLKYVKLCWETGYGKNYNIQVSSDGTSWRIVHARTDGTGGPETLALPSGTRGRYVRMQGVTRGTRWGYSLWEFQVFGN